jgi:adenine-specific DNA-methyltransferase
MVVSKLKPTFSLEQDLLEGLKQLIPEAISESKINWELLKEVLGEHLEEEGSEIEHFGLNWAGKRQARRLASLPSKGTLVPVLGEGIDEENTGNIFIEGDNLEVLKLLQKSYANRVKLIYIDPPYNTGNDFIYKDDFREPLEDYLRKTNQKDEEGNLLTSNPKSGGRFHSNWLNEIYPRLRLARNLLQNDGVIFVSIDDHEVHHLKFILNEIFGEENFIASIIWKKRGGPPNDKIIGNVHEYILVYAKDFLETDISLLPRTEESIARYKNPDNDPRGAWVAGDISANAKGGRYVSSLDYEIVNPNTGEKHLPPEGACWRFNRQKMDKLIEDNRITFGLDGKGKPKYKRFLSEVRDGLTIPSIWDDLATNTNARSEIKQIFGSNSVFETPKPIDLISQILKIALKPDELIVDFYSGSSSTAHAVLKLNQTDSGNRRFIMVQLPEPTHNNEYSTIAEIGKERIRRVIKKNQEERQNQLELNGEKEQDLGFKVYKLDKSNLKIWKNHQNDDIQALQISLLNFENPLIDGWKEVDVVAEIQLIEGFPLDSKIEQDDVFTENRVLKVASEYIGHKLFICLEEKLKSETIEQVKSLASEDIFICLDNALTDEAKLQLADSCNVKAL